MSYDINEDVYREIHRKRAERYARRRKRLEREEMVGEVVAAFKLGAKTAISALIVLLWLFSMCLWASV